MVYPSKPKALFSEYSLSRRCNYEGHHPPPTHNDTTKENQNAHTNKKKEDPPKLVSLGQWELPQLDLSPH